MSFEDDFKCAVEGLGVLESTFETEMDASGQMNIFGLGNSNWVLFFEEYLNIPIPVFQGVTPAALATIPIHVPTDEVIDLTMEPDMEPVVAAYDVIDLTGQADATFEVTCCICNKTEYSAIDASLNMVKYKNCACDHVVHGECHRKAVKISGIKHKRMTCYMCLNWI